MWGHKSILGHDAGGLTDLGVSSLRESFMESGEAKSLVDRWLKTLFFMPNFILGHAAEMSVLLNLVDSVHIKDREITEDESAEHLQLVNTSTLPSSDMAESTSEGFLGGFFSHFSPKEKVSVSKNKEKENRMSVIWTQRETRCGRCRSKARGNLNPSLIPRMCFHHHATG